MNTEALFALLQRETSNFFAVAEIVGMTSHKSSNNFASLLGCAREEGEYPLWIFDRRATRQQPQRSATRRAVFWRAAGSVAPQSESRAAIFLRRALPAARQKTARPFLILL
jgi:hypothetical protein